MVVLDGERMGDGLVIYLYILINRQIAKKVTLSANIFTALHPLYTYKPKKCEKSVTPAKYIYISPH